LSTIQTRKISGGTAAATVTILDAIGISALLQLHLLPFVLAVPVFLIPVSIYATVVGIGKKMRAGPHDYGYHLTWSAIMLSVGVGWVVLYEKMGVISGVISILSIILAYVYINKAVPTGQQKPAA